MSDSNTRESKARKPLVQDRKERVPMGAPRSKMAVPEMGGYTLRWFNNRAGRIERAELGGWVGVTYDELEGQPVGQTNVRTSTDNMGDFVTLPAGTDDRGSEFRAHLMKLPTELYEQDQAAKQAHIDEMEQGITTLQGVDGVHQYGEENTRIGPR